MGEGVAFCIKCGRKQKYVTKSCSDTFSVRGVDVSYWELSAYCAECGDEVYVPEIHDLNCGARESAYFSKIKDIL
jgi:hypothetical protein